MTIKTAVTLTTGAAVGFLFGLSLNQKEKEKIVSDIRGKIFFALTGEKIPKKKQPVNYKVHYSDYINRKPVKDTLEWQDAFYFESKEECEDFIERAMKAASEYGEISVTDVCFLNKNAPVCDYTWVKYGWRQKDVETWKAIKVPFRLDLDPKYQYTVLVDTPPKCLAE